MPTSNTVALDTVDGVRLHALYLQAQPARGPAGVELAVVIAHGFTGSSRNPAVRRITDSLVAAGITVLSLDFRGHGRSSGRSTVGDLEIHDVDAAVMWLKAHGHARVAVLGWSMGGSAVLRYAGLGGAADAVVAVSSPGTWFERGTPAMRLVHWLCETRTGRLATRVVRRTRLAHDGWVDVPQAPVEVVAAIAPTPLLIVHGDADHYFPIHHVRALAAAAPDAQIWIEAGMGHAETATTAELVGRIARWLRSVLGDASTARVCDDGSRD